MRDAVLQTKAKAALAAEPFVSVFRIETEAHDGVITVRGSVDNYAQKERVEELLSSLEGVTAVANQLHVGTADSTDILESGDFVASLSDEEIHDLQERIPHMGSAQLAVDPSDIKLDITNSGIVHLGGDLPSENHKQRMETILWRIPEVSYVVNRIEVKDDAIEGSVVEQPGVFSRAAAKVKFKTALVNDGLVRRPFAVGSEVQGDLVILTGDVDNYLIKDRVVEHGQQVYPGFEIADQLTVAKDAKPEDVAGSTEPGATVQPPDTDTADKPDYEAPRIKAFPGIPHAGSFAQGGMVSGGPAVPIKPLSETGQSDAKREVMAAVDADTSTKPEDLGVHVTSDGVCALTGRVQDEQEARRIEELAYDVRGVNYVVDFLEIQQ